MQARGENWLKTAEQPWNTPITEHGAAQARALGRAVRRHCAELGIPLPSRVASSPLLRCVQTARAAIEGMEVDQRIGLEFGLCETMCEDWYRSWAVPGADGTWGGHEGMGRGVEVDASLLHPLARATGSELVRQSVSGLDGRPGLGVDASYAPAVGVDDLGGVRWGAWEATDCMQVGLYARLSAVLQRELAASDDETTLFLSHGGPSAAFFRLALDDVPPRPGFTGRDASVAWHDGWPTCASYTGLYVLAPRTAEERSAAGGPSLVARLAADASHLDDVDK